MDDRPVRVTCYSGHTYAERPLSFVFDNKEHTVKEIEKEGQTPGARLFKVRTVEDRVFVLAYNEKYDEWAAFEKTRG